METPGAQDGRQHRGASRWARIATGLATVAGLTILLFTLLVRAAPEVQRGALLPFFEEYEVAQVRLLGGDFYVDTSSGIADLLTVIALAGTACALAAVAVTLARRGAASARTFALAAAGAAFLAMDDLLAAHETVGHNLGAFTRLPVVDHPDDAVVGLYSLVVIAFASRHRALAAGSPRWPWVTAGAAGAFAVLHDLLPFDLTIAEEGAEVATGFALLAGVSFVAAGHLAVSRPVGAPSALLAGLSRER